jgi:hypothetical protein
MMPGSLDDLRRRVRQTSGQRVSFLFGRLEIRVKRAHQDQNRGLYLGMVGISSPTALRLRLPGIDGRDDAESVLYRRRCIEA